jgi:hypothetical protein
MTVRVREVRHSVFAHASRDRQLLLHELPHLCGGATAIGRHEGGAVPVRRKELRRVDVDPGEVHLALTVRVGEVRHPVRPDARGPLDLGLHSRIRRRRAIRCSETCNRTGLRTAAPCRQEGEAREQHSEHSTADGDALTVHSESKTATFKTRLNVRPRLLFLSD